MRSGIARLNADGSVDDSFLNGMAGAINTDLDLWVNKIAVQGDGKILIVGYFTAVNGTAKTNIARLNPDGSLDNSFNVNAGSADYFEFWLQPDGKILLMGAWGSVNGVNLARFNADGTQDSSFHAAIVDSWQHVDQLALQDDGKMIVVGPAGPGVPGVPEGTCMIARLNADGSADGSFHVNISSSDLEIRCLVVQSDGKILLGGWFQKVDGVARTNFCRLNADGSLDTSFLNGMSGLDGEVLGISIQSDGKILVGGWFYSVNGTQRPILARLNTDGSLNGSFLNGMAGVDGINRSVMTFIIQSDAKILIQGSFWSVNGVGRPGFARLNADGSLDSSFLGDRTGPNGGINALAVQSDGKVLIAGGFNFVDGIARTNLARLNADGSLDSSFAISLAGRFDPLASLGLQSDDKILIAGSFTGVNGATRDCIARLNPDGSLDDSFVTSVGGDYYSYN